MVKTYFRGSRESKTNSWIPAAKIQTMHKRGEDSNISKQVPHTILLCKKADWDQLKQFMRDLHSELTQSDLATTSVQSIWDRFASKLEQGIDKFIPTRKSGTRDGFPWINQETHRLKRKCDELYKRWSRSGRPYEQSNFINYKHLVRRVSEKAYKNT